MSTVTQYPGEYKSAIARSKRVLLAAGFPWSVTTGRYSPFGGTQRTSAGVRVTRIGCSDWVSLHSYSGVMYDSQANVDTRRALEKKALEVLRAAGLPYDDRGWLACKGARRT